MNSAAASSHFPMAQPIYGYRPESGWPGALFQVFLQQPFIAYWQKDREQGSTLQFFN
jgi:hypothetical protein